MSTYIYLTCECHNPTLVAEDESGQHLFDVPQIQQEIADRELLVARLREGKPLGYFELNSARFLAQHDDCVIGIVDETGKRHPTTPTNQPETDEREEMQG